MSVRMSVCRVVKAKNIRKGNRVFVGGWDGEAVVPPTWREVTDIDDPTYDGRSVRLHFGEDWSDWETLDDDARVLVIQ